MPTDTTPGPRISKKAPPSGPAKTSIKSAASKPATAARPATIRTAGAAPAATIKTASAAPTTKAVRATRKRPSEVTAPIVDPEYRRALIAEAAYLRAERRNFAPGYEVDDWLNAESEVDTRLTLGVVPPAK